MSKEMDGNLVQARLGEAMVLRDMSQAMLAEVSGVSSSHISMMLSGRRLPSAEVVFALCYALEVSSDWLLGLPDRRNWKLSPAEEEALLLFRIIPDEMVQNMILNTLRVQASIFSKP